MQLINRAIRLFCVLSVFAASCSLEPKKNSGEIRIDLGDVIRSQQSSASPFRFLEGDIGARAVPQPGLGNFSCFGVNVIGPGIPNSGGGPPPGFPPMNLQQIHQRVLSRQSYCSYRGIISNPIFSSNNMDVSMQVPVGSQRVVQVIGTYSATQCANNFTNGGGGGGSQLEIYEIGRSVVDLFGDVSLSISNEWPAGVSPADQTERNLRAVDCEGCESFGMGVNTYTSASWSNTPFTGVAQKILLMKPGKIQRIKINAKATSGSIKAKIFADSAGAPDNPPTAASSLGYAIPTFQALTAAFDDYTFEFPPGGQFLNPGTYWIVFEFSGAGPFFFSGNGSGTANVQAFNGSWTAQASLLDMFFDVFSCP